MSAPIRHSNLEIVAPVERSGRRTPQTLLLLDERDKLLFEAARFYPGASDREVARRLRTALSRYRAGRWERGDRTEPLCPLRHRGTITELLWMILKVHDHLPSDRTIRRALPGSR